MEKLEPQVTQQELPQLPLGDLLVDFAEPQIDLSLKFKPSQFPKNEDGSIDLVREMLRRQVAGVYEVDTSNPEELTSFSREYLKLLNDEANRYHFTAIPESTEDMMATLDQPSNHGLAIYNVLGEVVGFATIEDAQRDQGDNWANKVVVVNNLQNKRRGEDRPKGIGTAAIEKVSDWAFTNLAYDGRQRQSLYAAIVSFVPNEERMYKALRKAGFESSGGGKDDQATVTMPSGKREVKPTRVLGLKRENWQNRKLKEMHEGDELTIN